MNRAEGLSVSPFPGTLLMHRCSQPGTIAAGVEGKRLRLHDATSASTCQRAHLLVEMLRDSPRG